MSVELARIWYSRIFACLFSVLIRINSFRLLCVCSCLNSKHRFNRFFATGTPTLGDRKLQTTWRRQPLGCAPGKINAPPRLTSQNISPAPFRLSLRRGQSFKSTDWKKKKRRNIELGSGFGRFLAAKIEFSYGAGQTVNLLALRLQWFESTPTHGSYRGILQVLNPLGG